MSFSFLHSIFPVVNRSVTSLASGTFFPRSAILPKGSFSPQEIPTRFPIEKKAPRNTLFSEYSGEPFSKAYAKADIRNPLIPSPARQAFRTLLLTGQ